jgi:hypothetical protein
MNDASPRTKLEPVREKKNSCRPSPVKYEVGCVKFVLFPIIPVWMGQQSSRYLIITVTSPTEIKTPTNLCERRAMWLGKFGRFRCKRVTLLAWPSLRSRYRYWVIYRSTSIRSVCWSTLARYLCVVRFFNIEVFEWEKLVKIGRKQGVFSGRSRKLEIEQREGEGTPR